MLGRMDRGVVFRGGQHQARAPEQAVGAPQRRQQRLRRVGQQRAQVGALRGGLAGQRLTGRERPARALDLTFASLGA